ncbi:hypothetical protein ACFQ2B_35850 [Streptomyces stramineus]|uniref:Uncharacterized protein n=1 Tax=Streptomyces stramineus TaxID=173861 RepID=A0ABN0ZC23_9ACTN
MNGVCRTAAAAVTGLLLALGSVVTATPAHADNEITALTCSITDFVNRNISLEGCRIVRR